MSLVEALILGLIQGIAEFLPISSSTHLELARYFLGIQKGQNFQYFDLVCHAGTMLAMVFFLRKEVFQILKSFRSIALFSLALIPLIPAYLCIKKLSFSFNELSYVGLGLLATAFLLFLAKRSKTLSTPRLKWTDVLCIGVMQTLAFIPGISRSGSTIAAARLCGWPWLDAAKFSFLLAIPTILGGECLETLRLLKDETVNIAQIHPACYAIGFFTSLIFGLFSIKAMFCIYETGKITPFIFYCAALGLLTLRIFVHA